MKRRSTSAAAGPTKPQASEIASEHSRASARVMPSRSGKKVEAITSVKVSCATGFGAARKSISGSMLAASFKKSMAGAPPSSR